MSEHLNLNVRVVPRKPEEVADAEVFALLDSVSTSCLIDRVRWYVPGPELDAAAAELVGLAVTVLAFKVKVGPCAK